MVSTNTEVVNYLQTQQMSKRINPYVEDVYDRLSNNTPGFRSKENPTMDPCLNDLVYRKGIKKLLSHRTKDCVLTESAPLKGRSLEVVGKKVLLVLI